MELAIGLIGHALLTNSLSSPWWIPNLSLIGLTRSLGRRPDRWLAYSIVVGGLTAVWAIRDGRLIMASYLGLGALWWVLSARWDMADARIQILVAGGAALGLSLEALWLEDLWTLALVGVTLTQTLSTAFAAWLAVRWFSLKAPGAA